MTTNIDINKLIIQLRTRISELEYDSMVKAVMIEQLQEDAESKDQAKAPAEAQSPERPVPHEVISKPEGI